jgi:YbbR domain-containing protein
MRAFFLKDWIWKLFSLVLAAVIWFTINHILNESNAPAAPAAGKQVIYGSLPVSIVSATVDAHLYRAMPDAVSVTVSGSPETIGKLQGIQLRVTVDLTNGAAPDNVKWPVNVSVPPGVALVSVEPQTVSVIAPPPVKKP